MTVRLRVAEESDCTTLFNWVNDPSVRKFSLKSDLISWEKHVAWFEDCLVNDRCLIYIAMDTRNKAVGQIRFDLAPDRIAEVDVSVAPENRYQGLGRQIIKEGVNEVRADSRIKEIHAWIKESNLPSIKAFQNSGFVFKRFEKKAGIPCLCLSFSCD